MKLYKSQNVFDRITGNPAGVEYFEINNLICDYTGVVIIPDENPEYSPLYNFRVSYTSGSEQIYEEDAAIREFRKMGIDYYDVVSVPYTFAVNDDYSDVTIGLVQEWMSELANEKSPFYKCRTIEEAMRIARVRTVLRLLNEKIFIPAELGLT